MLSGTLVDVSDYSVEVQFLLLFVVTAVPFALLWIWQVKKSSVYKVATMIWIVILALYQMGEILSLH